MGRMLRMRQVTFIGWMLIGMSWAVVAASPTNELTRVCGVVTFLDSARQLIVLQQDDRLTVLQGELPGTPLAPGERVELQGRITPLIRICPGFPDAPHGQQLRPDFEAPQDWADHFLSRLHGLLQPPTTGSYTFWIASDDSSELWLSRDEDPANAQRIAQVPSGRWTEPHQWTRIVSQRSATIRLEAGRRYYLEAIGQDSTSRDSLAVAWQGPGFTRQLLTGKHVTPGPAADGTMATVPQGVHWEYWTNFFSTDFSQLRQADPIVRRIAAGQVLQREPVGLPPPVEWRGGSVIGGDVNYHSVRLEGRVQFASVDAGGWWLELNCGGVAIRARVAAEALNGATLPVNSMVRLVGFYEPGNGLTAKAETGVLWVSGKEAVEWLDIPENWALVPELPQYRLKASNPELAPGQTVRAQGRLAEMIEPGLWRVEGKDTMQGFLSTDGTNWLATGDPMELSLSNEVLVGFAIASHRPNETALAAFDQLVGLEAAFQSADIGKPSVAGGWELVDGKLRVRGSGEDIWSSADQGFLAYQLKRGNFEVVARLAELRTPVAEAKVVFILRESLDNASPWAGLAVMPEYRVGLQGRLRAANSATGALLSRDRSYAWLKLVRQRNTFLVAAYQKFPRGAMIEVMGEVGWRKDEAVLARSRQRLLPVGAEPVARVAGAEHPPGDFRQIQIAALRDEADLAQRQARLVNLRIRGVVTYSGVVGDEWYVFLQDQSGSVRVQARQRLSRAELPVGDWVELTGAPVITESGVELIAHGFRSLGAGELPRPVRLPEEATSLSAGEGLWSEWEGVGRAVVSPSRLLLMTQSGAVEIHTGALPAARLNDWVNARIRVRGVMLQRPNPLLLLPGERFVQVLTRAPADPFLAPAFSIQAVRNLTTDLALSHRIEVVGTVTCRRGGQTVVQDSTGGIAIDLEAGALVAVGDELEVVGFPVERGGGIELTEVRWRPTGQRRKPVPTELALDDFVPAQNNHTLVAVEAILLAQHPSGDFQSLDVQAGARAFQVSLPAAAGLLPNIAIGSRLRLTGVIRADGLAANQTAETNDRGLLGTMELWLRHPADVSVVERPPWWNWKYTVASCGVVVTILIGAVSWIRTLRRRVEERTAELRDTMSKLQRETQISATLAERDRLAGEIHDSIEQGLSAIMMQMDAAAHCVAKPEEVQRYLVMARNMANFSRAEVQHAVWDMQSPLLENADLPTALRRVAADISAGESPRVAVEVIGQVQSLASSVEHHLLRIAQEAMTNAVKHGAPQNIWLKLEYRADGVVLIIRDDGSGFVPQAVPDDGGHFGLKGMRNRAQKLEARLSVTSQPGAGTCVTVTLTTSHRGGPLDGNPSIS